MKRLVANCKNESYDAYVGRRATGMHYGNPFTHIWGNLASVVVGSRDEAIAAYRAWLKGESHQDVEPERRQWILDHLSELKGKVLGCHCWPQNCHASVLAEMANQEVSNP